MNLTSSGQAARYKSDGKKNKGDGGFLRGVTPGIGVGLSGRQKMQRAVADEGEWRVVITLVK